MLALAVTVNRWTHTEPEPRSPTLSIPDPVLYLLVPPLKAFSWWTQPTHLRLGVALGSVTKREVVTTGMSSLDWGALWNGRGVEPPKERSPYQFFGAAGSLLSLAEFCLHKVQGRHVLVRTDNTTVVSYINHQGGLRSPSRHCVARKLLL